MRPFLSWVYLLGCGAALMGVCLSLATSGLSVATGAFCVGFSGCLFVLLVARSRGDLS